MRKKAVKIAELHTGEEDLSIIWHHIPYRKNQIFTERKRVNAISKSKQNQNKYMKRHKQN